MMMKMLEAGGLAPVIDGFREADEDNPKGYYELEAVKRTKQDPSWVKDAQGKVVKFISQRLQDLPTTEHYKVIFMRRHLDEVLSSQQKMLVRRDEEDETADGDMKEMFASHVEEVEGFMRAAEHLDGLFGSYNRMQSDSEKQIERVLKFLGADLDGAKMATVIDPALYRQRKA